MILAVCSLKLSSGEVTSAISLVEDVMYQECFLLSTNQHKLVV